MPEQTITCPQCKAAIPISDALTHEIGEKLKREFDEKARKKDAEFEQKMQAMGKQQEELEQKQKSLDAEVQKKLESEKGKLWVIAQQKAQEKLSTEMLDLQKAMREKDEKLEKAQKFELQLREEKRKLEDTQKNMELEMRRKLDDERGKIIKQAKDELDEESRRKLREKDQQMEQMRKTIDDLKRKSEQGSMQVQGDAQEEDLKQVLQNAFAYDAIEDVPAGVRGADLLQHVKNQFGQDCGLIMWESKNTKAFSNDWVKKMKDDQALVKADICILATKVMPDDISEMGFKDGIWIVDYRFALPLAGVLRVHLSEIHGVKQSMVGKGEKMEYLYNYLSGNEFRNRIENIVMAFTGMKSDLETEKRSMQRIWSKREKEIDRVVMSTSGLYGDLQGIIGASLPTIEKLELPQGEDDETLF
jgi:hypothetical protein